MTRRGLLLVAILALSLMGPVPVGASQQPSSADSARAQAADPGGLEAETAATPVTNELLKHADEGLFIVRLADSPVATYDGGKPGLARTRPDLGRGQRLRPGSPAARAYRNHLGSERAHVLARAERALGRAVAPTHVYDYVLNGFSAHFTPEEAARVATLPGVVNVQPDEVYELHTDNGPAWIGAPTVWGDGSDPDLETRGEGVLVGIVDTGINPSNPSFAEVGPVDGHVHTNPFGAGNFLGACDPGNPQYQPNVACNNKLVGAYNYVADGDPAGALDVDGHGSHTASTVAGNLVHATVESPTGASLARTISGVAPHANIISYRGCQRAAGCPLSALTASINQAIADGVDVINYSIGGGSRDPWSDENALAFLDARAAGVFVASSAGNSGPGAGTVGSPADAPWLTSVGASTHDRNLPNTLTLGGAPDAPGPYVGKSFTSGFGPETIVSAGDYPNPNDPGGDPLQCMEPYPPGTFNGEIVVCERGTIARVAKGANVLAGGAGGLVLANDAASGASLNSDPHFLPAVHISHAQGQELLSWLASGSGHTAQISGAVLDIDDAWGDVMAGFSSRGPNIQMDIISPNVTAPGVDIIAAYGADDPDPPVWSLVSGTSMSSPHTAGTGALLSALHPDWSPAEMQSALMTTAVTAGVQKEDAATPADPFDMGSGRIDVSRAARAGLVLDETLANYTDADPGEGGDPKTLNLPSMANSQCLAVCTWTRTVTATDAGAGTWQATAAGDGIDVDVSPSSFSLAAGQSQAVTITADVSGADEGAWAFGSVTLSHSGGNVPDANMPVAAVPTGGVLPNLVEIDTRRDAGSQLVSGLQALASPDLTVDAHGLAQATIHAEEVDQDPNNGNPYSPLDANWWTTFTVPEGTLRLVAEIFEAASPDLDMFIGTGSSPSLATEVCRGTTAASFEYCDIGAPDAGQWWVMVQGWATTPDAPDPFSIAVGIVPEASTGTMSFDAPDSVGEGEVFDIRLYWHADMEAGDRWYGAFTLSSQPANPGDIGTVPVNLVRHDDDVTKTVDSETAQSGDTLTYTITVAPNVTPEDLVYTIEDSIPDGLTYVEGSVTGGATVTDGVVSWSGTMPSPAGVEGDYTVSTNATDPSCATPLGGWVDLQSFGISPNPGIDGDGAWTVFAAGDPFQFYGRDFVGATLLATGFTIFDFAEHFGSPYWIPQDLPDPATPNNLIASLWQDTEIVYDPGAQSGVRLATLGGTGSDGWAVIDYDRVELFGGSADNWSHQLWVRRSPDPAGPDIAVAYNDLGSLSLPFTVGVENPGGLKGTAHVNAEPATGLIDNSTVVCFDYEGPSFDPHVITYQVTVDEGVLSGTVTNAAVHDTDNPGSQPETASAPVDIEGLDVLSVSVSPSNVVVRVGQSRQLQATAALSDGSTLDVTTLADWTSANNQIVTVSDSGLVTGAGGGVANVTATYAGQSGSALVRVAGPPPWVGGL